MTRTAGACVLLAAAIGAASASPTVQTSRHPRGYVCYRAASAITIDGRLTDAAWAAAPFSDAFLDIEGDAKPKPRHLTRVKMLWDDAYFYIGADLAEPHLWATLTDHDSVIFRDNDFEVFIDPNGDNHEYYELEINALGTTWDLLLPKPYKDDGKAVNGWEIAGLKSAVHLDGTLNTPSDTDRGWSVELALPWKALGELARRPSPPRDGDQWRVNFSRVQWPLEAAAGAYRKRPGAEENWVWSPQGVIDMHRPERWGYVQFSTAMAGTTTFVPDATLAVRDFLHEAYYAQREYRRANGRWAATLQELGVSGRPSVAEFAATLSVAGAQFQVTASLRRPGAPLERWHIRQDSLVWKERDPAATYDVYAVRFAHVPYAEASLVAGAPRGPQVDIAFTVWPVRDPSTGRVILVDAGFYRDKFIQSWKPQDFVRPSDALAVGLGIAPDQVTDIIVTHSHWDHADGADLFPRATIWIQKDEYEYYISETGDVRNRGGVDPEDAAMFARLRAAGRVRLVGGDNQEIAPGIRVYTGGKHTFASQYVSVAARDGTVILASDNAYLYKNLEERKAIAQTLDAAANLAAQARMIELAGVAGRVIPGHDPAVFTRFPLVAPNVVKIN